LIAGNCCRRAELKSAYGTHNVLADLHPRIHVDVVAKKLVVLPAILQPVETASETSPSPPATMLSTPEGKKLLKLHITRERNSSLVTEKKRLVKLEFGTLACSVCSFDFGCQYGEHGDGFIECHHTKPLSERSVEEETRLEDLALVCANCHRTLHRG
jgi:predicted HNH restriction endonuclease